MLQICHQIIHIPCLEPWVVLNSQLEYSDLARRTNEGGVKFSLNMKIFM